MYICCILSYQNTKNMLFPIYGIVIYNIIFPGTNPTITELQPLARDMPSTQCGISLRQTNIYR